MTQDDQQFGDSGPHDGGECDACDAAARFWVRIDRRSGTRSTTYHACARHESIARRSVVRFLQHVASKEEFLADPDAMKDEVAARIREERGR